MTEQVLSRGHQPQSSDEIFQNDLAETTLYIVIRNRRNLSEHRGDYHPNRLGAMIELARCYKLQNELECTRPCDRIIEGLRTIRLKQYSLEKKKNAATKIRVA